MVTVQELSYGFPEKDLYHNISFSIEDGEHAVLIGSNGCGKTTLVDMLIHTEDYLFDGKLEKDANCKIGYVSQVQKAEKDQDVTVLEFLSHPFEVMLARQNELCDKMATETDLDAVYEEYQKELEAFDAVDGNNYESNIHKQLATAKLTRLANLSISQLSGGEYKLVQVIKEMMRCPGLLIMDEPDVFLDFSHLNGLRDLINGYAGTMLVITHNRYLLNHCFDKVLHLENTDLQEFEGNYIEYRFGLLQKKVELLELAAEDEEEIARNEKIVERLRADASRIANSGKGKQLKARVSLLERLKERRIKAPFVEIREPNIVLPEVEVEENNEPLLTVADYSLEFDELLLSEVNFELLAGEKVALVGPNGTGKTSLLRDIFRRTKDSIQISENARLGVLSQIHGEMLKEENSIYEEFFELGFETKAQVEEYLADYCFLPEDMEKRISVLSGGEKNLLQLAKIARTDANLLLLDEPTSHLDTYAQMALEKALQAYKGAVLMVSHDFYSIAGSVDYVLYVEENSIRRMRIRSFRKMIYENHFNQKYLELEQKKKELETKVESALKAKDYESAKGILEELSEVIAKM